MQEREVGGKNVIYFFGMSEKVPMNEYSYNYIITHGYILDKHS
jgi:hypothetical protein